MGVALYIVSAQEVPDLDPVMDGKALGAAVEELTGRCNVLGVKAPLDFVSQNPEDLVDLLGEELPTWGGAVLQRAEEAGPSIRIEPRISADGHGSEDFGRRSAKLQPSHKPRYGFTTSDV